MRLKKYSPRTRKSYLLCVKDYFNACGCGSKCDCDPVFCDQGGIKKHLSRKRKKGASAQTLNLYLNAIRFFYREVVKEPETINIKFAKPSCKSPNSISRKEIEKILKHTTNDKHRLIIALAYGTGMRIGEIVRLKVKDIQLENLLIRVREAGNVKSRLTIFPERLKDDLHDMMLGKRPGDWLFEGLRGGKMSERATQKALARSLKSSGIKKQVSFGVLRDSFAIHLLESGVDVKHVQRLLGHANIRTTKAYEKAIKPNIKNIRSPLF